MHQPYHPNIFMMSSPQLEQNRHPQSSHLLKYIELFPEIIPLRFPSKPMMTIQMAIYTLVPVPTNLRSCALQFSVIFLKL